MPFITEEIWQAIYEGHPPLNQLHCSISLPDEQQFDLTAETEWPSCRI